MRQVAQYVFSESHDPADGEARYAAALQAIDGWTSQKGWRGDPDFALTDGRSGQLDIQTVDSSVGSFKRWTLLEEINGGFFETALGVALTPERVHVSASLSVGHNTNQLAPLRYEARCPSAVRKILDLPWGWRLGRSTITTAPIHFSGKAGGESFVNLVTDVERSLPVIALSSHYGLLVHREIDTRMARDLVALATVAVLDDDASWEASARLGRVWSCYNGAVRLYWPGLRTDGNPLHHPLWTSERLLNGADTVDEAERRMRDTLRKRLMAVSVPALVESKAFDEIRQDHEEAQEAARLAQARDASDYQALAELEARRNDDLKQEVAQLKGQLRDLRQQLYRFQMEDAWADAKDTVEPDSDEPPESVEEAVAQARKLFADRLRFGGDVAKGVGEVSPVAGPPEKVFGYLKALADLASARRDCSLGDSTMGWLAARNVTCSDESKTTLNDRDDMKRRTWDDGAQRRPFTLHLKPSEATHPDRCVRIYFDWDEASEQVVVGWVGRHP